MSRPAACPSTYALERFLLGEDPGGGVGRHVAGCEACQRELESRRALGAGYVHSAAAEASRAFLLERARASRPVRRSALPTLMAAAAASLALVAAFRLGRPRNEARVPPTASARADLLPKGPPLLSFFVERGGAPARPLTDGRVRTGDRVQPVLSSAEPGYIALLSRSLEGEVTVLFADRSEHAAAMPAGARVPLGASFRIDGPPTTYALWFFFDERPFDLETILPGVRAGAPVAFAGTTRSFRLEVAAE